jgi:hypothetical protein
MEDNLNFLFRMDDNLIFFLMEEDSNFSLKWNTPLILWQMEDNLYILENGSVP